MPETRVIDVSYLLKDPAPEVTLRHAILNGNKGDHYIFNCSRVERGAWPIINGLCRALGFIRPYGGKVILARVSSAFMRDLEKVKLRPLFSYAPNLWSARKQIQRTDESSSFLNIF